MIYLILSSNIEIINLKKGEFKYYPLLKIGYTKDIDSRFETYLLHNPGCKLLDKREGDIELESYFHSYYSKYKYPYRGEWFYYSQDIIDNFQTLEIGDKFLSKEKYIEGLKEYLKSKILTPGELKNKYLNSVLEELKNIKSEIEFNESFHKSFTMSIWKNGYEEELDYLYSFDFQDLLKNFPDIINLKKNPWKDISEKFIDIYKRILEKEIKSTIETKKRRTESLIRTYYGALDIDKQDLVENYQSVLKNYNDNYLAVKKLNNILTPIWNDLLMINETRAYKIQKENYGIILDNVI